MEARMTICNMSIEMGARGRMIAPDETTFEYLRGREFAPQGAEWDAAVERWSALKSEPDAVFDKEVTFDAADIEPMITYGTNPGMGVAVNGAIPASDGASFDKALDYMGFREGEKMAGKRVDYVFVGSLHQRPHRGSARVRVARRGTPQGPERDGMDRPGSKQVERQAIEEGLRDKARSGGIHAAPARVFGMSGHERGQDTRGKILRGHLQPQLRRSSGSRGAHHAGRSLGSGRGGRHGRRDRPARFDETR